MTEPMPLRTLDDATEGELVPLPPPLAERYGPLRLAGPEGRPLVIANFVETLDGVVALDDTPKGSGSAISGNSPEDRVVMGLLRAVADVVVVGAGTLRAIPRHRWTAEYIYPPLKSAYAELRVRLGKPEHPLNVIVSASGRLPMPSGSIFRVEGVPVLVVTTAAGAVRLAETIPSWASTAGVMVASEGDRLTTAQVLDAIHVTWPARVVLVEGGPRLLADFLAERRLDELFLTLSPRVAGRDDLTNRPGLVAGRRFAPLEPHLAELLSIKRAGSHLFLRYRFSAE